ncbi:MAG TPA: MipA/OmpV family protein [Pseudolabrys sp.]
MRRVSAALAALAAMATLVKGASAADIETPPPPTLPAASPLFPPLLGLGAEWTVTIGAEGRTLPEFEGGSRYSGIAIPRFNIRQAGTPEHFYSPRQGFGVGIIDTGNFRFGPVFKLRLPRNEGDDYALHGLGNVDWTLEAGVFGEYWPTQWLRTRAEVRQGIGGHHGIVSDLMADVVVPVTQQLRLSGGPRLSLATAEAEQPYFGITPEQSINSGLPVYNARGGIHSWGAGAQAHYQWTPQWATYTFVEYQRLEDGAADSPLVIQRGTPDQVQVGLGATYEFDMKSLW